MIKLYDSYISLDESGLKEGDSVIVLLKSSKYFMKTGKILSIRKSGPFRGDCLVSINYEEPVEFYYSNIKKIHEVIEVPTGEVVIILDDNMEEAYLSGIVKFNKNGNFYYFNEEDRWQVEYFEIW